MSNHPWQKIYEDFVSALRSGNRRRAAQFIAPDFRATPDEVRTDLTFEQLCQEAARMREAFSDFGKKVKIVSINIDEDERWITVTYVMTMTFDGPLRSAKNRRVAQPTHKTVTLPSQDRVEFRGGKIVRYEVVTDMNHTLLQMIDL